MKQPVYFFQTLKLHSFLEISSLKSSNLLLFPHKLDYLKIILQIYLVPQLQLLAERFITNNDLLSHKRKETELKRLQTPNPELKVEFKVKFQGLNPHPIFHVSKIEHKTSPAPFEVVHIEFERDRNQPTITYGKTTFCNPYSGLKYTTSF